MLPLSLALKRSFVSDADTVCFRCLNQRARPSGSANSSRTSNPSRASKPTNPPGRSITTSSTRRNQAQDVPFFTGRQRLAAERSFFWANGVLNDFMGPARGSRWKPVSRKQSTAILDGSSIHTSQTISSIHKDQTGLKKSTHNASSKPEETSTYRQEMAEEEEILPHRRRKKQKDDTPSTLPLDASNRLTTVAGNLPINSLRRRFATYLSLSKPRLSFLIVLTTTAAYSIYPVPALLLTSTTAAPSLSTLTLFFLTTGTFLTCASANALNMLFEPEHDAKMSRTRNRPLVRKLISSRGALIFAIVTGITGTAAIYAGVNPTTSALAAFNIFLYAGVYTPMKRISVVNTWVGALVGAIPPLMGWTAAAGQCATGAGDWKELLFGEGSAGGWLLAAYLFCWQFPHFNALSWPIREEYKNAGYRMLAWVNPAMNARVALRYSVLMFPVCIGLAYVGVVEQAFIPLSCVANGWVMYEAVKFWRLEGAKGSARSLFWASVWHLPIVLVLGMVLKKGLWERIWSSLTGVVRDEDDWEDEYEESRPLERQPVPLPVR
ncbi:putative amino-acid permease [Venturia inaequalis]|nr:putative amino-acid permease [Venturia inaequalis]